MGDKMKMLLVSPRAIPPWDSATATLARTRLALFSRLKSLGLIDGVLLLTFFRNYSSMHHVHENSFGNEIYCDYIYWLKKMEVNVSFTHSIDPDLNPRKAQLILNKHLRNILHGSNDEFLLWNIGSTPFFPYHKYKNVVGVIHEHYVLDESISLFKKILMKTFTHTSTSKHLLIKLLSHGLTGTYLPPALINYFDSSHNKKLKEGLERLIPCLGEAEVKLLYMGPLLPERFPINVIIPLLRVLKREYKSIIFVAITTFRSRKSLPCYNRILQLVKVYDLGKNFILKLIDVESDTLKSLIYRMFDVLIYTPVKPVEMSDPPLTVLEAMNNGLPPIISPIGDLASLIKVYNAGIVSRPVPLDLFRAVKKIIRYRDLFSNNAKRLVREHYSDEVVMRKLRTLINDIMG